MRVCIIIMIITINYIIDSIDNYDLIIITFANKLPVIIVDAADAVFDDPLSSTDDKNMCLIAMYYEVMMMMTLMLMSFILMMMTQ